MTLRFGRAARAAQSTATFCERRRGYCVLLLAGLALAGCAHRGAAPSSAPPAPVTYEMEPVRIEATRGAAGLQVEAYDAAELFEAAGKSHTEGRLDEAVAGYERLLTAFPDSQYAKPGLYNLALVLQDQKKWQAAADRFRAFLSRYPEGKDARDAQFQLGATLAEGGDWAASRDVFAGLLERNDLSADDRVEAMARRGFATMNNGDLDGADAIFRGALAYKAKLEATAEERLQTDYYLAFSQFQIAEISHRKTVAAPLRWPEAQMNADLEEKARLLLQSRRQYIDAVRYGNPRIASMAAFQIGSLFQEFYDALLSVPVPDDLKGEGKKEARQVYDEELRKKLRVVLEKALRGHEHNIELFERLGVETEWVTRSRAAIARLRGLLDPGVPLDAASAGAPPNSRDLGPAGAPAPITPTEPSSTRPNGSRNPTRPPEPSSDVQRQIL